MTKLDMVSNTLRQNKRVTF